PPATGPESHGALADRLRDIEAVTDAALSRLDEQSLLVTLLERVKKVLQADTAAVLLVDRSARQLVATAASGCEEEVRQGVRGPLGAGFAGRVAATRAPVILTTVDPTTVRNPLLVEPGGPLRHRVRQRRRGLVRRVHAAGRETRRRGGGRGRVG